MPYLKVSWISFAYSSMKMPVTEFSNLTLLFGDLVFGIIELVYI